MVWEFDAAVAKVAPAATRPPALLLAVARCKESFVAVTATASSSVRIELSPISLVTRAFPRARVTVAVTPIRPPTEPVALACGAGWSADSA